MPSVAWEEPRASGPTPVNVVAMSWGSYLYASMRSKYFCDFSNRAGSSFGGGSGPVLSVSMEISGSEVVAASSAKFDLSTATSAYPRVTSSPPKPRYV